MKEIKFGFDSFQLKVLALIFMTFDHVAYFLSGILPVPYWFHLVGRLSAPIFIFVVANGFRYTHNRISYMRRLYGWSVFMGVGNFIANRFFMHPGGAMVMNNIFATMFYIVFFLYFMLEFAKACREKKARRCIRCAVFLLLPFLLQVVSTGILASGLSATGMPGMIAVNLFMALVPVPLLVEGSILWIILGVGFYFCREHKIALTLFYVLLSGLFFLTAVPGGLSYENLFLINNQWFMVFTLPFLLLYNRKKGKGMKYLFYLYYPLHIYVLLALAHGLA